MNEHATLRNQQLLAYVVIVAEDAAESTGPVSDHDVFEEFRPIKSGRPSKWKMRSKRG
jgi:hypothetical protein